MLDRIRFRLGELFGVAICEPKRRLGRRRHDNYCDYCKEFCGRYAMDRLTIDISEEEVEELSFREMVQVALDAEYERVCIECGDELEDGGSVDG